MATTHIDTTRIPRARLDGQGEAAEIISKKLCGAENVNGLLRWLHPGDRFVAEALENTHQLLYLIEGEGVIQLNGRDYPVAKGAGVHLGPTETASISHTGENPLKIFHLIVPIAKDS